ncbi:MAG: MerR family transcriptional regulator [Acidimicrobiia bacterium]|nr:MerR family transcriptional regulator [Acidimicrobiia bacterium]
MTDHPVYTIGKVREILKEEFAELSTSKIRFLESNGLIHPGRSSSGYRQYQPSDIDRLRYILRRQRDFFLPLKVIKRELTKIEQNETGGLVGSDPDNGGLPDLSDEKFDLKELARRSGLSLSQVSLLDQHGLFLSDGSDGDREYSTMDVVIARQSGVLLEEGLEPRHIRQVRHAASRQTEMLNRLTLALRLSRNPAGRRQARETLKRGAEAIRSLHQSFLAAEVKSLLDPD